MPLEKLTVCQLVKFPALYGTRNFATCSQEPALTLIQSQIKPILCFLFQFQYYCPFTPVYFKWPVFTYVHVFCVACVLYTTTTHPPSPIIFSWYYLAVGTIHEASHYTVLSSILSLPPSCTQISSSALCYPQPLAYALPLMSETKFHTRILHLAKPQSEYRLWDS